MEQPNDGVDETMNVYFNDVTLTSSAELDVMFMQGMKDVWDEFMRRTNNAVSSMRSVAYDENERLCALATEINQSGKKDLMDFFHHKIVPGYKQEIEPDNDSDVVDKHDSSDYSVEVSPGGMVPCRILGWAMLNHGITFGLASSRFWNQLSPDVNIWIDEYDSDSDSIISSRAIVACVTRREHLDNIEYASHSLGDDADEVCDPPDVVYRRLNGDIIVLGANNVMELKQVAADVGFDIKRFIFIPYERVSNYDCRKWKNSKAIVAIMCGPVPHSCAGMGDSSSLYETICTEPGYPLVEPLQDSTGKLRVTVNSFRVGLMNLMRKKIIDRNFD